MTLTSIMARDPDRRELIRQRVVEGVENVFPLKVRDHQIVVSDVHVQPKQYSSREQKEAILHGRTLQEPLRGNLTLKDATGKTVEVQKNVTLAQVPFFTPRHTFIVDGNEYTVAHQRRVRPGVYTRVRGNEELEAMFNLAKGENFRLNMSPEKGHLYMEYGSSRIPLYPILRGLGVSDKQIRQHWGSGVVDVNKEAFATKQEHAVKKLYERLVPAYRRTATTPETMAREIDEAYRNTAMDREVTQKTLGQGFSRVTPTALLRASQKLLDVHRTGEDTDDRDSLAFQTLHGVDDFFKERIQLEGRNLARKVAVKASGQAKPELQRILPASPFTRSLRSFVTNANLSAIPSQINPVEILDSAVRITSLGEGGISSERAVPPEARNLHSTHLGIIDPIRTPESFRAGVDLRGTIWTHRDENGQMFTKLRNVHTGKIEYVPIGKLEESTIAFPGEMKRRTGISALQQGYVRSVPKSAVDYEVIHPAGMYGPTTNLVPMPESLQGNRTVMGSKMATQALPLIGREAPYIQVASSRPGRSFEEEIADLVLPTSPVDGVVKKIDQDYIYIQPERTKKSEALLVEQQHVDVEKTAAATLVKVPYDNNYPLASKTYLHDDLKVKTGDRVHKGQQLADSNFTRDGSLALGRNMRVGYMAYYGANSNDAVVISEDAAQKLTSTHMYKEMLPLDNDITLDKKKHRAQFPNKWTATQYGNLDDRGVAKTGATIQPGDPVILALRKVAPTAEMAMLGKLHRTLATPYREEALTWSHKAPGVVQDVVVTGSRAVVTVKTEEPAGIGDKLCFTQDTEVLTKDGWKAVEDITVNDVLYTIHNGQIELHEAQAVHHYPCADELYELQSQQVDLRVTTNHALYIKQRGHNRFERIPARVAYGKRCRHKKDGEWRATTPETFELPTLSASTQGKGCGQTQRAATRHIPIAMKAWLRFLGAYLANGSFTIHKRKDRPGNIDYCTTLHTIPGQEHSVSGNQYAWLQSILDECGFAYMSQKDRLTIHSKQLTLYLSQFGHAGDKHVPSEVFLWGRDAAQWILEGLLGCDGHHTQSNSFDYTTTSPRLADDVQRLALHRGWSANIKVRPYTNPRWATSYRVQIVRTKNTPQINHGHHRTQKAQHEDIRKSDEPVWGITVENATLYVRVNGKPVWTGNSGRYGNKGVISKIVPTDQMIRTKDDRPVDILMTSAGIVSRVNPAQIVETAAAKVAEKTGKRIIVPSLSGRNNVQWAKDLLKEHGLTDKEVVHNPVTGRDIVGPDGKGVMVGPQYIYKLFKSTDTNYSARGVEDYDVNLQPAKGGEDGAKGLGRMEINALLAHNARNVLQEASTLKSTRNDEFWRAYQLGQPLPRPKPSFAYDKLGMMIHGAGIKFDKSNEQVTLGPLTDHDIDKLSSGALTRATMVRERDLKPEKNGLFDPVVTGGTQGTRWAHVDLREPIVNPTFEEPVRRLLGYTQKDFRRALATEGGQGIRKQLRDLDLAAKEKEIRQQIDTANGAQLDNAIKQMKYIKALRAEKLRPDEAYTISKLPVVPPVARPIMPSRGKRDLLVSDANYLYRDTMLANEALAEVKQTQLPDEVGRARLQLYDATRAVFGLADPLSPQLQGRQARGFISTIAGQGSPKGGFFHGKLLRLPQDLSGRGTAVPDLALNMDQIGLPEDMMWKTFQPHLIRDLVQRGYKAVDAQRMIEERHPAAREVLLAESKRRPVLVNRAPTLHRYGIVGAYAVPVPGKTIRVNPFIEQGMNLDFDGDALQIHIPVADKAVEEVKAATTSNLLFGDRTKSDLMVMPQHEAVLGIYAASAAKGGKTHTFKTQKEALEAYRRGEVALHDSVKIG